MVSREKNLGLSPLRMSGILKSQEPLQTCSRKGWSLTVRTCLQMREVWVGYGYVKSVCKQHYPHLMWWIKNSVTTDTDKMGFEPRSYHLLTV